MIYIFIALVFYAVANVFIAVAARGLNAVIVSALMGVTSMVLPVILAVSTLSKKSFGQQKTAILAAVLAGLCIAVFSLALNKSYAVNKVGIVMPLVFGGAIFLSTFISYFAFKEKISPLQLVGLLCVLAGLAIIAYARSTTE